MGFKPYSTLSSDVIVGKGGYVVLDHSDFKHGVWATLEIYHGEIAEEFGRLGVEFLGWNVAYNCLPCGCDYEELTQEQQELLQTTLTDSERREFLEIMHPDDYMFMREWLVLVHGEDEVLDAEQDSCRENWDI